MRPVDRAVSPQNAVCTALIIDHRPDCRSATYPEAETFSYVNHRIDLTLTMTPRG
jgi:hypothetical protein